MLNLTESEFITAIKKGVLVSGYEPTERRHVSFDDMTVPSPVMHGIPPNFLQADPEQKDSKE
ncbi:hypothetical protein [Xenorhabdus bovienii]|uniref:Uncharacterized protein n=1 Tax=Xenorhabdus bovienii str. feltiae Moldova TaxID=1398200 RepID=A0A077NPE4_XENBV|nr:hypothetical protein [Xenorhabdus bovienii]CDG99546.1 hypothetical protein XBFM1_1010001 [Xenorhabdus bovienii str. feltiae Moldova]